jgi:hypothetical protein
MCVDVGRRHRRCRHGVVTPIGDGVAVAVAVGDGVDDGAAVDDETKSQKAKSVNVQHPTSAGQPSDSASLEVETVGPRSVQRPPPPTTTSQNPNVTPPSQPQTHDIPNSNACYAIQYHPPTSATS